MANNFTESNGEILPDYSGVNAPVFESDPIASSAPLPEVHDGLEVYDGHIPRDLDLLPKEYRASRVILSAAVSATNTDGSAKPAERDYSNDTRRYMYNHNLGPGSNN